MSRHAAWRILSTNLNEEERAAIIKRVEQTGQHFDVELTALVRRGMTASLHYCPHCGAKLQEVER